jgi:hypothetical protein
MRWRLVPLSGAWPLEVLTWPLVVCGRVAGIDVPGMSSARIVLNVAGSGVWTAAVTRRAWLAVAWSSSRALPGPWSPSARASTAGGIGGEGEPGLVGQGGKDRGVPPGHSPGAPAAAGRPAGPSGPAHPPGSSAAVAAAAWRPRAERHSLAGDGPRHRVAGQELHLDRVPGQRAGGDRTYGLAFTRPVPSDACRTLLPPGDRLPREVSCAQPVLAGLPILHRITTCTSDRALGVTVSGLR